MRALIRASAFLCLLAGVGLLWVFWPRPPDEIRDLPSAPVMDISGGIVTFGTSLTASAPWPDQLQDDLFVCAGRDIPVIRVAQNGMASPWGLSRIDDVIAADPALVLIEFAINDADLKDGLWLGQSRDTHAEILDRLATALPDTRILLMSMNPVRSWRKLQRPRLGAYYAATHDMAAARGLGFLDLYARWQAAMAEGNAPALIPDGVHPTADAVAQVAYPALFSAVSEAYGLECEG